MLRVDLGALGVEDCSLDWAPQELLRMAAEELVERVLAGDIHGEAPATPSRPAPHLPEARNRARKGDADRRVKLADDDPKLERIGRDHGEQLPGYQALFDLSTLRGRVAGAIGRDSIGELAARDAIHGST